MEVRLLKAPSQIGGVQVSATEDAARSIWGGGPRKQRGRGAQRLIRQHSVGRTLEKGVVPTDCRVPT